ncbi:MAG: PadR family transcriptional regulator [Methanobrevibacter sp.]|jgi:DNA-binding PadR family transcriptional regulator|nr:PadR family transcriptional regulator [Methanobrevibacter sp.]
MFDQDKLPFDEVDQEIEFTHMDKHMFKAHSTKKMFNKRILTLVILWIISKERTYGYALIKKLNEGWDNPIDDEDLEPLIKKKESFGSNRIYPILRILESRGLIVGTTEMEGKRKIKYYEVTKKGILVLEKFRKIVRAKTPPIFKEFFEENFFD